MCPSCKNTTLIQLGDLKICGKCWTLCTNDSVPLLDTRNTPIDPRPDLQEGATVKDIVFDYAMDGNKAVYTSRVYCPMEEVEAQPFNPNDPNFKFAMKVHRKRFKNRRRYMYEKQRKAHDAVR
jgi:hypothetical protein